MYILQQCEIVAYDCMYLAQKVLPDLPKIFSILNIFATPLLFF